MNDIANNVTGNVNSDVNGEGIVGLSDFILVDNNNMNYVSQTTPPGIPQKPLIILVKLIIRF
jgi:hypothetical protein